MNNQKGHVVWLDQVRGAAALYVVFHHAVLNTATSHGSDLLWRVLSVSSRFGHYAVDVFIVLSGYCLMLPLVRHQRMHDIGNFFLRRFVRIVLPYYAALALSLLLIATVIGQSDTHWKASLPVTVQALATHLFLVHQLWPETTGKINHPLWSVGVEWWIYFLLPALLMCLRRFGPWGAGVGVLTASYAAWGASLLIGWPNPSPWGASFYYIALFLFGMVAAHLASQGLVGESGERTRRNALLFLGVLAMVAALTSKWVPWQVQSAVIGLFTAAALLRCATHGTLDKSSGFVAKALGWAGRIGFSLYLLHAPLLEVAWQYIVVPLGIGHRGLQGLAEVVFGLALSLAAAQVFYSCIESPCHRLSRNLRSVKTAVPASMSA